MTKSAEPDRIYDLDLPEGFHRNRRTMLIFTAAALVVGIARVAEGGSVNGLWGNVALDRHVAWFLLWGAASYYAAGFAIDARAASRQWSKFALKHSKEGVDAAIDALGTALMRVAAQLDQASIRAPLKAPTPVLQVGLEAFWRALAASATAGLPPVPGDGRVTHEELERLLPAVKRADRTLELGLKKLQEQIQRRDDHVDTAIAELGPQIEAFRSQADEAKGLLDDVRRELGRLSPRIITERRWHFYLWEVASPFIFFAFVTLLGLPLMGLALLDILKWIVAQSASLALLTLP